MGAYVMSFTFIIIVPFVIGYIVVYFSKFDGKSSMKFQIITPWLSIYILLAFTYLLYLEGLICIIMAAPVFMVLSSLGGLLGGEFANDKKRLNIIFINIIIILPFFSIAVENKIEKPIELMQVDTQIEIKSDPGTVWENIVTVYEISDEENRNSLFMLMGFPKPIKAELDYKGIGGTRLAIFDKGLFFTETVTEWDYQKSFSFKIKADPNSVPPEALDEHVLVGGEYFDILDGKYEIESVDGNVTLHLQSKFKLSTNFNFYSGFWSKLIMKDIQNNILNIVKQRSEKNELNNN